MSGSVPLLSSPRALSSFLHRESNEAAILAPGRQPLSYRLLSQQIRHTAAVLRAAGVAPEDRVAVVLPNGPEMAACFLGVVSAAACAPLNPAYRLAEFSFYLEDLRPKLLIVAAGTDSPVRESAATLGIPILELFSQKESPAGMFTLGDSTATEEIEPPHPQQVALVLHTSGTTSRPKIVPLRHANLAASVRNIVTALALGADDRCLNPMPLFHIHGLMAGLLSPLAAGGSVVCAGDFQAPRFFAWIDEFAPTWYTAVPTMHQAILARAEENRAVLERRHLRFMRSSSSPLPPSVLRQLEEVFQAPVLEAYGMTEASHQMACNPLPPRARKPGSVGVATGIEIAILDESGTVHHAGDNGTPPGEVAIRGESITAGYASNPQANTQSFLDGWFRTGDIGHLDCDGYLFLSGRTKEMINRGGEKIAPREVDEVLLRHPAVAQAVAFAMPDPLLGEDVAAAIVLRPGAEASEFELREFVAGALAHFKVPRRFVFLEEIPKGPTGKPQRIGLAERLGVRAEEPRQGRAPYRAPAAGAEMRIAAIWEDVLEVSQIGADDDFFAAGGDSLLAATMLSRLGAELGKSLAVQSIFLHPVLAIFAEFCQSTTSLRKLPPIGQADRTRDLPVSFAQERMWFLTEYEPDSTAYSSALVLRLTGSLNQAALQRSVEAVQQRHEVLRTVYRSDGTRLVQQISERPMVNWRAVDLPGAGPEKLREFVFREHAQPFDLSREAPLRARLLRTSESENYLLFVCQHIAMDGWSKGVLVSDLAAFYAAFADGKTPALPPLAIQYADYAVWRRVSILPDVFNEQLSYWKDALRGSPVLLQLPTDRPRPRRQTFQGGNTRVEVPAELLAEFNELCRGRRATLFMGLLAVWKAVLSRYSGMTDIVVGSPIANREPVETEHLIGVFINTLALRTNLVGDPDFPELLDRVRQTALGAYENRHVPFATVIDAVQPVRSIGHTPIYQVMFQLRNFPARAANVAGLNFQEVTPGHSTVLCDLELEATETAGRGLGLELIFNTDLFDSAGAEQMLRHFEAALRSVCRTPQLPISKIPLLGEDEKRAAILGGNSTGAAIAPLCVPRLFEMQAESAPHRMAVRCEGREYTYEELNRRANRIANGLRQRGIGPGDLVGISLGRTENLLAGLLGVLKSGAAYVPFDALYPAGRLAFMQQDSNVRLILSNLDGFELESDSNPEPIYRPDAPAYVLYTSGSTGTPKGVAIPHGALTNALSAIAQTIEFQPSDRWFALTTVSFDIAAAELFVPLLFGGSVEIAPDGIALDGARFAELLESSGSTILQTTPSSWRILLAAGWRGSGGLRGISGGEELSLSLARQLRPLVARLWNFYGPTETTIWSTAAEIPADPRRISIGTPLANNRVYVLDRHLQPQPAGVAGDLYIGGAQLASGYLNRPELTAERFLNDPFAPPGSRLYRTGDMARMLRDGSLEFCCRADQQVKIRGFRIELEEIESALARHPGIRAVAVAVHTVSEQDQRLAAYFVTDTSPAPTSAELRAFLQSWLPGYMIPGHFTRVPQLPRTANGKIDRKSLAALPVESAPTEPPRPPANSTEARLAAICAELLGRDSVGVSTDLFSLGAHSLLLAMLVSRIENEFGCRIPLPDLFAHPTVESLAAIATGRADFEANPRIVPVRGGGLRPPLFWIKADPMFRALADRLPADQPIFGLFLPDDHPLPTPFTIEDAAAFHLETLRQRQPVGPYLLGGFCAAGLVAYEIAQRLTAMGEEVSALVLLDTRNSHPINGGVSWLRRQQARLAREGLIGFTRQKAEAVPAMLRRRERDRRLRQGGEVYRETLAQQENPQFAALKFAALRYRPRPYSGNALLVHRQPLMDSAQVEYGWTGLMPKLEMVELAAEHLGFFFEPQVSRLAEIVAARLSGVSGLACGA